MSESGTGPPLILCHGGPGLWDMFGGLAPRLAGQFRVVRWDQRGCGRSDRRGPYSLGQSVADLDAVRRSLAADRVALLGHSWGAQLALRYALDHPDRVTGLVYLSGVGLGWAWREPFEQNMAQRLAPHAQRIGELAGRDRTEAEERELAVLKWSVEFTGHARARQYAEHMATPWLGINLACSAAINNELEQVWHEPELAAACQRLTVPTLIIDGATDPRPRWAVDSLARALPLVTRVTLPDAGHVPWLEDPAGFAGIVLGQFPGR
ncbi:MAG TPA: alpha/beta hydrolase [Streptosporangiaceae bacterium]|jgi:proline iminopeptidase